MDVLKHITELMEARGWNLNQLAAQSSVPQSTLSGLYQRNNIPSIPTLEKLCAAFGITMSQFFAGDDDLVALTDEQRALLGSCSSLSDKHKKAVWDLICQL